MSGRRLDQIEARLLALGAEDDLMRIRAAPLHALLAVFQGQIPRAAELARRALEQLPEQDSCLRSVALLDLTIVHYAAGNTAAGKQALADAYRTARASGNVMIAVIALTHMAEADMGEGRLHQAEATYQQALGLAVGPNVLRLIAEGLSNQEIARRLAVSLPTVKWHTGNIYGKLGVTSRTQAVVRARDLGILTLA